VKNWDKFKTAVSETWNTIKVFSLAVWETLEFVAFSIMNIKAEAVAGGAVITIGVFGSWHIWSRISITSVITAIALGPVSSSAGHDSMPTFHFCSGAVPITTDILQAPLASICLTFNGLTISPCSPESMIFLQS
jgi:hypothetical protein